MERVEETMWEMAGLITPMALRVAATLRLADLIAAGSRDPVEIARAAGADPSTVRRLLDHLAFVGVVEHGPDDGFALTERGECLRDDHPSGLRSMLDINRAFGRADLAAIRLLDSVRTGLPAYPLLYERSFWEDIGADPVLQSSFDARMGEDVAAWAPSVVAAYEWSKLGHLVDVGGGDGTLLIELLRSCPTLEGTVFEQPVTAGPARSQLKAAGLTDRCSVVAGDFFDAVPAGAGGYLLSAILHDWDDVAAATILRRCAQAAGPGGRVLVVEKTGPGGESVSTEMDLRLLAYFGGRERGVAELTDLAAAAGFCTLSVHPAGDLSVIELVPDPGGIHP